MANRRIEVDIVANDKASSVFKSIGTASSSMAGILMGALGGTVNAVGNLDNILRSYNASMWRYNRVVGSVVRAAGDSIYNFTSDAINNFTELEQQHAKTMGAMATEYGKTADAQAKFLSDSEKLKKQALTLGTVGPNGKGSLYSPVDVSYAQTALVKSGMSADDLLNSTAVSSILQFAGGNDLDIDTATTFAVNLATVFDKPVEEWGKMLDMVTKAADISVIDVTDIMDSLTYTGGIASGLGRDLEEVLGVISVMGQAGLRGRVAGTGLQALFTRILSNGELTDEQIGKAPTKYVGQVYNAFLAETTNKDGTFRPMDEVAATLDTVMESLNDQEQAWFAKKLFGLYQMKAAYALTGAVDGDTNLITDFIDQISNQSEGTNQIKYELMQASQYGKIESLKNAWEGVKTDVGDKLSPVVSAIADEFFAFLTNDGNYNINWDKLRQAFEESGDLIGEKYGEQLGKLIKDAGNFTINSGLIANALVPEAGGILEAIVKLLNGDISGALESFWNGLKDTNDEIENLPPELQDTANAAKDVIAAFTILSGINLSTQILQIITTAFNTFIGKPIQAIKSLINSTTSTVNTTTTSMNTASATVNIASIARMDVLANIVNVYGVGGNNWNNPTNPTNPTTGGGPIPQGGPVTYMLPGVGGAAVGAGASKVGKSISSGTGRSLLTDGSKATTMYDVGGGKMMSMSQIIAKLLKFGIVGAEIAGVAVATTSDESEDFKQGKADFSEKLKDVNFLNEKYKQIVEELNTTGELTSKFLTKLATLDGQSSQGADYRVEQLLETIFPGNYKRGLMIPIRTGYTTDYVKNAINSGNIAKGIDTEHVNSIVNNTNNIVDGTNKVIDGVNQAMNRIQNPVINVNVTTNVDKSGNAITKTDVDISALSRSIARQASRYGINNSAK